VLRAQGDQRGVRIGPRGKVRLAASKAQLSEVHISRRRAGAGGLVCDSSATDKQAGAGGQEAASGWGAHVGSPEPTGHSVARNAGQAIMPSASDMASDAAPDFDA
jgi:hypothetical protein